MLKTFSKIIRLKKLEIMLKFKAILSAGLFVIGLVYWSLNMFTLPKVNESNPFKTIYAITGDENSTVEILKCADIKSVEKVVLHEDCCSEEISVMSQKKCLEDWAVNELVTSEINY